MEYDYTKKLQGRHVLFTPLNWGLGHATRSIPLIKQALKHASSVTIASDGMALLTLKAIFPELKMASLPAYDINYKYQSMIVNGIMQYPKAKSAMKKEKEAVSEMINKSDIDLIISDNRFGCFHEHTESILLTHQLNLQHPNFFIQALINFQNKRWLQQFDAIWVPDYENSELSGKLSSNHRMDNVKFIGPQSIYKIADITKDIDLLIVLSGPEPQRSILESKLLRLTTLWEDYNIVFVSGSTLSPTYEIPKNVTFKNLTVGEELNTIYNRSKLLICRSGYSTLMDLDQLKTPHILIPTPGQTEQEYLAKYWKKTRSSRICIQKEVESKLPELVRSFLQ